MDFASDFDRLFFFEHARKTAEATYVKNPQDADNLTRWGGVLLELSQFQNGPESKQMVAFLIPDFDEAKDYFDKANQFFQQACELDPENDLYKKSLEVTSQAPALHTEIHKHGLAQQAMGPAPSASTSTKQQSAKKSKNSDLKYDVFGWIILAVGIVAWVGFAKSNMPPPPPR